MCEWNIRTLFFLCGLSGYKAVSTFAVKQQANDHLISSTKELCQASSSDLPVPIHEGHAVGEGPEPMVSPLGGEVEEAAGLHSPENKKSEDFYLQIIRFWLTSYIVAYIITWRHLCVWLGGKASPGVV